MKPAALSFAVFFIAIHCGQLRVQNSVLKPVVEDSVERRQPTTVKKGLLNGYRTKAALIGSSQRQSDVPSLKGKEKFRRQVLRDGLRRDFEDWDGEYNGNGIEQDRFPTFGKEALSKVRPYKTPGEWATPAPESGIDLGFTPVQTYIQVRKTNKVEHLPRSEAINEASSLDEVLNAHRLKEVLRTKKIQEVYSEEGYEDSAYDHGDHERHAEHDEGFAKAKDGKYKVKDPVQHIEDIANAESKIIPKSKVPSRMEPIISRKRVEATKMKMSYMDDNVKTKESKKTSSIHKPKTFRVMPSLRQLQGRKQKRAHKYSSHVKKNDQVENDLNKRKHNKHEPIEHEQQVIDEQQQLPAPKRDFVSPKGDFWSLPSVFEDLTRSTKWGNNPTTRAPKTTNKEVQLPKNGPGQVRIAPIPTFGYIHSLTDAHYGTQAPMARYRPKPIPSHVINLTDQFKLSESKTMVPGFEPRRLSKRIKRESPEEVEEEKRKETSDQYEKELSKELDQQEKKIISEALRNLKVTKDIGEGFPNFKSPSPFTFKPTIPLSWRNTYDSYKYPYFFGKGVNPYSPLRYASHPREFPRKSGYGMEFYESRDREVNCDPVSVDLNNIPKSNSTRHLKNQPGKEKRIIALGDKIQCLKIKYFGEDPLDSPFFKEDELKEASDELRPESSNEKPQIHEGLMFHSSYNYKPNRTMDIFVKSTSNISLPLNDSKEEGTQELHKYETIQPTDAPVNETHKYRVIPVTENYIQITSVAPIMGMRPPPMRRPFPLSLIKLPPRPNKSNQSKQRISYKHNCLYPVTRMIVRERTDEDHEVIFDCQDAIFIETIKWDGNKHIRIIPKMRRSDLVDALLEESMNPRAGEVLEGNSILLSRGKRATPSPNPRKKTKLFPNKSLLDKIVKKPTNKKLSNQTNPAVIDLGDKSPEEIQELQPKEVLVTATTTRTIAQIKSPILSQPTTTTSTTPLPTENRKIEPKPLSRLSGKAFLDRYHKSKSTKSSGKPIKKEFWKVPEKEVKAVSPKASEEKQMSDETTEEGQPLPTPVLLYIIDESTGRGQWVQEEVTSISLSETSTKSYPPTSGRQQKNQEARKKFFSKKLKKAL